MSPIFRKLSGRIAVTVALVVEGALLAVTGIGMTTTADDAENLPRLVQWLLGTPWWVPALVIPLCLLAFAAWIFRPDQITANAMREYKAANDRAWEFTPEFRAEMAKLAEAQATFLAAVEELKAIQESYIESQDRQRERLQQDLSQQVAPVVRDHFNAQAHDLKMGREREFSDRIAAIQNTVALINARLDAQPQSPQSTASETQPQTSLG